MTGICTPIEIPDYEVREILIYQLYQCGNWMIPSQSYNALEVLQQGAMNVMGGVNNEVPLPTLSTTRLAAQTPRCDMAQTNMSHQVYGAASAAMGDVQTTSFP